MTNFKTVSILTVAALGLFAVTADASEMKKSETIATKTETESRMSLQAKTAVLEATERQDLIPVTDNQGNVFFNHIVDVETLPDTELNIKVQDSFTYEYNGRIYTNVIVDKS